MGEKMNLSRGCFDRGDETPDTTEYASPPCYMHEVDPSYFGLMRSTEAAPTRKPHDPGLIMKASAKIHALRDQIVIACRKLRKSMRELRQLIGKHPATQKERLAAPRRVWLEDR